MQLESGLVQPNNANKSWLSQFGGWLIDLVFPPVCGCGRVDFHFCADCLKALRGCQFEPRIESQFASSGHLDGLASSGIYVGILAQAIRAFKYDGILGLDAHLAERLRRTYQQAQWSPELIMPVPLANKRRSERGYNQSEILGHRLSAALGMPFRSDLMRRIRETHQQTRLNSEQRKANVEDAFAASDAVKGLDLLLIDDVVTTGSTLSECARALKSKGATAVFALAVGRA